MRNIKFRAWDKNKKRYSRQDEQSFLVENNENESYNVASVSFDYELEQFTGLYDKNGKEIYENDVIAVADSSYMDQKVHHETVGYNRSGELMAGSLRLSKIYPNVEIVGNVHETPELLEEKYARD
ncbi:MAG: hypothetical protein [Caudoviricetes sp.]|nr:MAG: hypothetical protein [Caudoviricetes sp.]